MDDWDEVPRWAMIYGGNKYIIYLVLPILVGGMRRCALVSSGVLYIDDIRCPFTAIMLYMLLSADMPHERLAWMLDIKLPPKTTLATSQDIHKEKGTFDLESKSIDCRSISS
jgi:hypothetical protein